MADLKDIITNVKTVHLSDSAMATLLDFERVLDTLNLYAFENWKMGELVSGPNIAKYRVSCTFMWPKTKKPNTLAIDRLSPYDIDFEIKEDWLSYPIEVKSASDFRPGTKKPRLVRTPIWLITIDIPKTLMSTVSQSAIEVADIQVTDAEFEDELNKAAKLEKEEKTDE